MTWLLPSVASIVFGLPEVVEHGLQKTPGFEVIVLVG
jgi:hypothetical protein